MTLRIEVQSTYGLFVQRREAFWSLASDKPAVSEAKRLRSRINSELASSITLRNCTASFAKSSSTRESLALLTAQALSCPETRTVQSLMPTRLNANVGLISDEPNTADLVGVFHAEMY